MSGVGGPVRSVGVSCDGRAPAEAVLAQARAAEAAGAASFWISSHLFQREPIGLAALVLARTRRIRVALMGMSPYTIHPVHAAMAAATLDEAHPGRVVLGLGVGAPGDLASVGVTPSHPVGTMREALEVVRALLAGERVRHAGRVFRVEGRALASGARALPVVVAASGPQMLELAGAHADGVILSAAASVAFVRASLDHVGRGARGRPVRRLALVYAATAADERTALDRFRRVLALTLRGGHHARNLEASGIRLDQAALQRAVVAEDWAVAEALVTDDVVRHHAVAGTADRVRTGVRAYHEAGLDEVVLTGLHDPEETRRVVAAACGRAAPRPGTGA